MSKLLILDINDPGTEQLFRDFEDMGFTHVPDLGYINKHAVVGSKITSRVLKLWGQ